jgi:hypothetical protein
MKFLLVITLGVFALFNLAASSDESCLKSTTHKEVPSVEKSLAGEVTKI